MSWHTYSVVLMARDFGRLLGLNRWIVAKSPMQGYETKFDSLLSACMQPADYVWDIGANIGYYTKLFAERIAPQGTVLAFEPSPVNYQRLCEQCALLSNIELLPCGLGKHDAILQFEQGKDELGATSRVIEDQASGESVLIRSADSLLEEGIAGHPDVIKIDVEGYEWEVLEGMSGLLKQSKLRTIGIEVHFGLLKARGMGHMPQQIERLLHRHGFLISWPDNSHILGTRNTKCRPW